MYQKKVIHQPMGQMVNKQQQRGLTLIEVLVSVIVMVLGILALLATQLRTVSGAREAEAQTIVAQATQNRVEGMLTNPILCSSNAPSAACPASWGTTSRGWTKKNYSHYNPANAARQCNDLNGQTLNKTAWAAHQLCKFNQDLTNNLQGAIWAYQICIDSSGATPVLTGTPDSGYSVDFKCDNQGDGTVVKVIWQTDSVEKGNTNAADKLTAERAIYTYQTYVNN